MSAAGFPQNFASSASSLVEFFRTGGWFIAPILVCWFISITVIIWKALDLRRKVLIPPDLVETLRNAALILREGRFHQIQKQLSAHSSVLARICQAGINPAHLSPEAAFRSTETVAREELSKLERGIPVLEIIFTIAPMLGLIGTVSGLVTIFSAVGSANAQSAEQARKISLGIAEAMNTTIAGLVVAVPALIAQVLYTRHLERIGLRLTTVVTDFMDVCWSFPARSSQPAGAAPVEASPADPPLPSVTPDVTASPGFSGYPAPTRP